ncbi:MAG TPA: VCBS repeat-containing protein [Pirellulales bacterium]|nr:VCBS repeat-containing protein [Pirellulales bacterium]
MFLRCFLLGAAALGLACASGHAQTAEVRGWQGMRVIRQEGNPDRMVVADLDGSGRDQLIVVNTRQSRLDLYRWLPPKDRPKALSADPQRPNELPMAPEWSHREIALDELPSDVVVHDIDDDGKPELLVLAGSRNQVMLYKQESPDRWKKQHHWDLLAGSVTGKGHLMLLRHREEGKDAEEKHELLISFEQGIQVLSLEKDSRAGWLSPREAKGRRDWALADLDGDGEPDLVEWSAIARQDIRWYEASQGSLLPAQSLHEHSVQGFGVLERADEPAELLLLGTAQDGALKRYQMARGETSDLGRHDALPIPGGTKAAWCGMLINDKPVIVASDPAQPRLRVHELGTNGWLGEQSYPTVSNVRALASVAAEPGTLLEWVKDAADLYKSRWESGRLSYPQPMTGDETNSPSRVVALDTVGDTTWWAQRVGPHMDLYVWKAGEAKPEKTHFADLGAKIEKVVWLGGKRILVQDAYASSAKLATIASEDDDENKKVVVTEPSHLAKVDVNEFGVYLRGKGKKKTLRIGRLTDGVLQWLGDDLHPTDQTMLPDGQKLASFVPLAGDEAWALEQGGGFIHRLKPDEAGVLRVSESIKPPHGTAIVNDPILGLVLVDTDRIVRLSKGSPFELKLIDSVDSRIGRPSGVKEATIHRFFTTDVDGDGQDEVILADDRRHQLTVLERTDKGLKSMLSWQVFEDVTYPYGGQGDALVTEPRAVMGLDADGDGKRDLALLSQDRLLLYMGEDRE